MNKSIQFSSLIIFIFLIGCNLTKWSDTEPIAKQVNGKPELTVDQAVLQKIWVDRLEVEPGSISEIGLTSVPDATGSIEGYALQCTAIRDGETTAYFIMLDQKGDDYLILKETHSCSGAPRNSCKINKKGKDVWCNCDHSGGSCNHTVEIKL